MRTLLLALATSATVFVTGVPDDYDVIESLDTGIDRLERIIQQIGDVRMILIDPITSFVGKLDFYRDDHIRRLVAPLGNLAAKYDLAVLSVLHMNKDTAKKGNSRILGGGGFVATSRSTLFVAAADKNSIRRFLIMGKANLWPERKAVEFTMHNVDGLAQIHWGHDFEDLDLDEVLAGKNTRMTKQDHAAILLRRLLADGPVSVVGIKELAIEAGISFKTFIIAKKEIGIASEERADGWWWSLPRE